jgi:RNA polymerase sigma factor (sigma-70 family)
VREIELEMRLRNNRLKQRRRELCLSGPQIAEQIGICYGVYIALESMRRSPLGKTGEWRPVAMQIAKFHGASCEELWPDSVLSVTNPVVRREIDARDMLALLDPESHDPERLLAQKEDAEGISRALDNLSARESDIIVGRFYDGLTYEQVGARLHGRISGERVRQIERNALRKLQRNLSRE